MVGWYKGVIRVRVGMVDCPSWIARYVVSFPVGIKFEGSSQDKMAGGD